MIQVQNYWTILSSCHDEIVEDIKDDHLEEIIE